MKPAWSTSANGVVFVAQIGTEGRWHARGYGADGSVLTTSPPFATEEEARNECQKLAERLNDLMRAYG